MRAFADYNPIALFFYFAAAAGITMFCRDPVIALLSLAGSVLLFLLRAKKSEAKTHLFSIFLFAASALINPLVSHNGVTVLFVLNDNPVTLEALIYGAVTGTMLVSALYWFRTFSDIMTSDRLLYLFGALSPKAALILSMALRYIPLFARRTREVRQARKGMGLDRGGSIPERLRSGLAVFSIMLTWTLEDGIVTADSMSARGYDVGRRTHFSVYRFRRGDALLLAASLLLSATVISGEALGTLDFVFYPALGAITPSPAALAVYVCFGALAFMPSILDITEKTRWNCLQSKI